jgi:hypothetical protein
LNAENWLKTLLDLSETGTRQQPDLQSQLLFALRVYLLSGLLGFAGSNFCQVEERNLDDVIERREFGSRRCEMQGIIFGKSPNRTWMMYLNAENLAQDVARCRE